MPPRRRLGDSETTLGRERCGEAFFLGGERLSFRGAIGGFFRGLLRGEELLVHGRALADHLVEFAVRLHENFLHLRGHRAASGGCRLLGERLVARRARRRGGGLGDGGTVRGGRGRRGAVGNPRCFLLLRVVPLRHDVVDVRLQRNADVLALFGVELEDVQHPRDAHLEEYRGRGRPELHDIPELRAVQVLHRRWTEEMDAALVDPEHDAPGEQTDGILDSTHREEDGTAVRQRTNHSQQTLPGVFLGVLNQRLVSRAHVLRPIFERSLLEDGARDESMHPSRERRRISLTEARALLRLDLKRRELRGVLLTHRVVPPEVIVLSLEVREGDEHGLRHRLVRVAEHALLEHQSRLHSLALLRLDELKVLQDVRDEHVVLQRRALFLRPVFLIRGARLEQKLFAGFEERECRVILQPDDPGQARQRVPDRRHAVVRELLERLVEEKDDGAQTAVIAQRLELFRRRRMPARSRFGASLERGERPHRRSPRGRRRSLRVRALVDVLGYETQKIFGRRDGGGDEVEEFPRPARVLVDFVASSGASAESTSSSRSSGRLIVSRTSLCTVAASSAGGTEGSVTRRRMAGLILTDLATASVLSLRSDVGMGVALCASMCSTVRGPSVPPGVFGLARMKDIMPPPEPLFTALLIASTLNLSSRWAMESNALSPG